MCVSILMLSVLWRHLCRINIDTHIGTRYVILAKHWVWLPDDGFIWTETCWNSFNNFNYFNNLRILQFVCISWKIKCLILQGNCDRMKQNVIRCFRFQSEALLCTTTSCYTSVIYNEFLAHKATSRDTGKQSKTVCCYSLKFWVKWQLTFIFYRGADKSLARPDWKNNCKVAIFRPTRR